MLLRLDGRGPRYAQITRALTAAIQDGDLAPGTRVPSTRALAADLECARNVVLLAYEQLTLEGYLITRHGGGTFVSPDLGHSRARPTASLPTPAADGRLGRSGERLHAAAARARQIMRGRSGGRIDFMYGLCQPDARTLVALRSAFATALRTEAFGYAGPAGDEGLRTALADRLRAARGMLRSPEQIVITSGTQQAIDTCARLLLNPGDHVGVEDPGYASARAVFEAAGATVIRLPVDRDGLDVNRLAAIRQRVRLVYVTPSHQFPTGAVLSVARRYALLDWARQHGAYIVEDDYDGEYRYTGRPIEALAALDPAGPVLYCGTLAKALFPGLRLGYLSVPPELVEPARHAKWVSDCGSPLLLQRMVAALMATGDYERHIRRMTRRYRARRDTLVDAVHRHLGDDALIDGGGAGLHLIVWLPRLGRDRVDDLIAGCARRDVSVYPVAPHAAVPPTDAGLLLGYGLVETGAIAIGIARLAEAYRALVGRAPSRRRA
jgi:GntR family transcriptional regulator/MocR family aminotransferase